jgi:hypothetical protein
MSYALNTYPRLAISVALALAAPCVFAASAQAADAEDLYEAAAMMHTQVVAASFVVDKCGSAYPGVKKRFQADFAAWRSRDAKAIGRAEALWQDMEMSYPRSAEEVLTDQREAEQLWAQMQHRGAAQPENIGEQRCNDYLGRLVAGTWRTLTPKMYRFLEN